MATQEIPDVLLKQEEEERAFLASLGIPDPEPDDVADLDAHLDALLEQIGALEQQKHANDRTADIRIKPIEDWRDEQNAVLDRRRGWIEKRIREMTAGYDYRGRRSRTLSAGKFGWQVTRETVDVLDPQAAVRFAEANGLEIKKSVGITPLLRHLRATGELADGAEYVPPKDRFFVRVNGGIR